MDYKLVVLLVAAFVAGSHAEQARFDNYRVYKIKVQTVEQFEVLQAIENYPSGYIFWDTLTKVDATVDLVVPPHKFAEFADLREKYAFEADLFINNLQESVDSQQRSLANTKAPFGWDAYHRLDSIYAWLDSLAVAYPNIVTPIVGGESYQGRLIKGVKISYKFGSPGVFIESNIHAREWVTSATVTWVINELITSKDPAVRNIAENYDWYIFPVVNPDGFEYTHTNNRLWRKTRSPQGSICTGADPNRNWAYNFMQGGASSIPCADTYAGPFAFSEIETRTLSNYYKTLKGVSTYLSFHSYSQLLLFPFGHTTEHLGNYDDLMSIGTKAINKLKERYGTQYQIGNIAEAIYIASGGSIDWIKGDQKTPITYTYELRDQGRYGFLLPADQIIPTAEETLDSIIVILEESKKLGYH